MKAGFLKYGPCKRQKEEVTSQDHKHEVITHNLGCAALDIALANDLLVAMCSITPDELSQELGEGQLLESL